jgi:chromosome segregation ATPase
VLGLAEQQQLLHSAQEQQRISNEEHTKIQTNLVKQEQEKKRYEDDRHNLSRQINEQQRRLNEKQEAIIHLQVEVKQNKLELTKTQNKYNYHQQQLNTNHEAIHNIDKQIINIDTRKRKLTLDMERKTNYQNINKDLLNKKKTEIDNSKEHLKQVTNTYNEKNKACTALNRNKNVCVINLDRCRTDQAETNRKLEGTQNRLTTQRRITRHLISVLSQLDMTKNLAYQKKSLEMSQEVFENNTLKMEEVEEIDQPIHLFETRKSRA